MCPRFGNVRLRDENDDDRVLFEELQLPEEAGPWDTFDEPAEEMLHSQEYGGGRKVIELAKGTPVGSVSFIRIPYGPNRRSLAWRIGITVLSVHRNRGVGSTAQRLLAEDLFKGSTSNRVEADTDIENLPEQRALEKAGFVREGIIRGAQWRSGRWHDRVLYSRLRSDQ
jgi:RimJ/RimL family protein N-acetyltransferase